MLRTVLLSILVCSFALQTQAAEIEMLTDNEEGCTARLVGEIQDGDYDKVQDYFSNIISKNSLDIEGIKKWVDLLPIHSNPTLCFLSPGGSLIEALSIAKYLSESGIGTHIEKNASCLSACAWAFLGGVNFYFGVEDSIEKQLDRTMHFSARLGFHSPQLSANSEYFTYPQLQGAFNSAIKATTLIFSSLDDLEISLDMALLFFSKDKINNYFFIDTLFKAKSVGIEIIGMSAIVEPKTFSNNDLRRVCQNLLSGYFHIEDENIEEELIVLSGTEKIRLAVYWREGEPLIYSDSCFLSLDTKKNIIVLKSILPGEVRRLYDLYDYTNNVWKDDIWITAKQIFQENGNIKAQEYSGYFIYGDKSFLSLLKNLRDVSNFEDFDLSQDLNKVFINYDADVRAYLQRTLRNLGLYSSSIDGKWGKGTEGAFQKLFDTMDEYYPDLKWRQDFGFDDGVVTVNEFGDFWNAAVGCGQDKMLKITNLCQ